MSHTRSRPLLSLVAVAALVALGRPPTAAHAATQPVSRAAVNASAGSCANLTGAALAGIADALTSGNDAAVLRASLRETRRMRACGAAPHDRASLELIAADAAGDTNAPALRCELLTSAATLARTAGETSRAGAIDKARGGC